MSFGDLHRRLAAGVVVVTLAAAIPGALAATQSAHNRARKSAWSAEIIFTAPGDFPQRILAAVEVRATSIQAALADAVKKGQTMGLDSEVVKIERTSPSWKERNA